MFCSWRSILAKYFHWDSRKVSYFRLQGLTYRSAYKPSVPFTVNTNTEKALPYLKSLTERSSSDFFRVPRVRNCPCLSLPFVPFKDTGSQTLIPHAPALRPHNPGFRKHHTVQYTHLYSVHRPPESHS